MFVGGCSIYRATRTRISWRVRVIGRTRQSHRQTKLSSESVMLCPDRVELTPERLTLVVESLMLRSKRLMFSAECGEVVSEAKADAPLLLELFTQLVHVSILAHNPWQHQHEWACCLVLLDCAAQGLEWTANLSAFAFHDHSLAVLLRMVEFGSVLDVLQAFVAVELSESAMLKMGIDSHGPDIEVAERTMGVPVLTA